MDNYTMMYELITSMGWDSQNGMCAIAPNNLFNDIIVNKKPLSFINVTICSNKCFILTPFEKDVFKKIIDKMVINYSEVTYQMDKDDIKKSILNSEFFEYIIKIVLENHYLKNTSREIIKIS
jgi:hypothetical protein